MSIAVRMAVFAAATALLAYISRGSLLKPRSHGFFRFFAWEAILVLALLQLEVWFDNWLSWHQILSWGLLFVSFIPLGLGVDALRRRGGPRDASARPEKDLLPFERTTKLVNEGVYKLIRHPLYSSLLLLAWGLFFKAPSVAGAALVTAATACLLLTARADEAECLRVFGPEYRDYMMRTKMFIPYLF